MKKPAASDSPNLNMRHLAALCGVSAAAVSKAFSGHPSLPPRTRSRILEKAREMGYVPDPGLSKVMRSVARGWRDHQEPGVGLLFPWYREHDVAVRRHEPSPHRIFQALLKSARVMGYRIESLWLDDLGPRGVLNEKSLRSRGIEGLIVLSSPHTCEGLRLDIGTLPVVAIGRMPAGRFPVTIDVDHFEQSLLAFTKILRCGYKRPAFVLVDRDFRLNQGRLEAALDYHRRTLMPPGAIPNFLINSGAVEGGAGPSKREVQRLVRWIDRHRPDVVLSTCNEVREWISPTRFRIPEQIGFASLNPARLEGNCGTSMDWGYVGGKALLLVDYLFERKWKQVDGPREHYLVAPVWMDGTSLRCPRDAHSTPPANQVGRRKSARSKNPLPVRAALEFK